MTKLEYTVIDAVAAFRNYDDAETEKADNAVAFTLGELWQVTGLELTTLKGVVGSLFKKDVLCEFDLGHEVRIGVTDYGLDLMN